jgi:hypothetical protein
VPATVPVFLSLTHSGRINALHRSASDCNGTGREDIRCKPDSTFSVKAFSFHSVNVARSYPDLVRSHSQGRAA